MLVKRASLSLPYEARSCSGAIPNPRKCTPLSVKDVFAPKPVPEKLSRPGSPWII
jgi:hypothetical protein